MPLETIITEESECFESIAYDSDDGTLYLRFRRGGLYVYFLVDSKYWFEFNNGNYPRWPWIEWGLYFNDVIRKIYWNFVQVGDGDYDPTNIPPPTPLQLKHKPIPGGFYREPE